MIQIKQTDLQKILVEHYTQSLKDDLFRIFKYEQKYGMPMAEFKAELQKQTEEDFEKWDDLIEWEALASFSQKTYQRIKSIEDGIFEIVE